MSEPEDYLEFAKELAAEAGKIMQRYFQAEDIGTVWKEDATPLTVADTTINELVINKVKAKYPGHGVLGEESSYQPKRDLIWVVDPIDGTIPFSLAMPFSTFSLGLVDRKDGQPVVGVIYDPFLDHIYWAVRGRGAFLNDLRLRTSKQKTLDKGYTSVLGSWDVDKSTSGKRAGTGIYFERLEAKGAKCFSLLSQAYSAVRIASGELVGSIFAYGSPWDSAAVALIVTEAGGVVTDMAGKPRRYDKFEDGCLLSANPAIHKQLLEIIDSAYNRH